MKVFLDNIIFSHAKNGGISNYWYELSNYMLNHPSVDVRFYEDADSDQNFYRRQLEIPSDKLIINTKSSPNSIKRRLSAVVAPKVDHSIYHSSYYRRLSNDNNYREVVTVHDFTHNFYSPLLKKIIHNKIKYSSIKRSKGIICISENTFKDLRRFCPPQKGQFVTVIHNGVSDEYQKLDDLASQQSLSFIADRNITRPYLLFIGSRVSYKNFSFVTELFKTMPNHHLVIVGSELSERELKRFTKEELSRVSLFQNISNIDLNILYNNAEALLYPSNYEGFGIPVIEAMKAGCPVLALNSSSITEIAGDAGILFESLDVSSFRNALFKLFENDYRQDVIEKGLLQSQKYSWQKCCQETYEFYREVY